MVKNLGLFHIPRGEEIGDLQLNVSDRVAQDAVLRGRLALMLGEEVAPGSPAAGKIVAQTEEGKPLFRGLIRKVDEPDVPPPLPGRHPFAGPPVSMIIHVDARGQSDPAATERAAKRGAHAGVLGAHAQASEQAAIAVGKRKRAG